jgi:uncharacterized membrane protein YcaP (DUF421 family)
LENSGQVSILLKAAEQPPTAKELQVAVEEHGLPLTLVHDGVLLEENLRLRGLDQQWLRHTMESLHVSSLNEIYLLTADESGQLYFARKESV